MEYGDFRELVRKMRTAQIHYFRNRDPAVLNNSKRLEREVDAALNEDTGDLFTKETP